MLVAFVLLEMSQRLPMLDLSLFRNGTFAGANIAVLLVALAMFGVFFFVSLYMQGILGYSAVERARLPSDDRADHPRRPDCRPAADRWGVEVADDSGCFGLAHSSTSRARTSTRPMSTCSCLDRRRGCMALVMTPSAAAAIRALPVDKSGRRSAVLNAFRQVGARWIALIGAIMAHEVGGLQGPAVFSDPARFVDGFSKSLTVAAVIALVGAIVSFALVRPHEIDEHDPRREPIPESG